MDLVIPAWLGTIIILALPVAVALFTFIWIYFFDEFETGDK
jgi:hypothetical protein